MFEGSNPSGSTLRNLRSRRPGYNLPGMGRRNLGGVFLRGKTWWVHYSRNGVLVRESSGSKVRDDAIRLLATRQAEVPLAVTPRGPIAFEALFDLLAAEYDLAGRRSAGRVRQARKRLAGAFGGERAEDITSERISGYAQARRQEGAAAATVRYELAMEGFLELPGPEPVEVLLPRSGAPDEGIEQRRTRAHLAGHEPGESRLEVCIPVGELGGAAPDAWHVKHPPLVILALGGGLFEAELGPQHVADVADLHLVLAQSRSR